MAWSDAIRTLLEISSTEDWTAAADSLSLAPTVSTSFAASAASTMDARRLDMKALKWVASSPVSSLESTRKHRDGQGIFDPARLQENEHENGH